MRCDIEVQGRGEDARCSIRYEYDYMVSGDKTHARVEALHKASEVVQLLFGYPELQEMAQQLSTEIADVTKHPMP